MLTVGCRAMWGKRQFSITLLRRVQWVIQDGRPVRQVISAAPIAPSPTSLTLPLRRDWGARDAEWRDGAAGSVHRDWSVDFRGRLTEGHGSQTQLRSAHSERLLATIFVFYLYFLYTFTSYYNEMRDEYSILRILSNERENNGNRHSEVWEWM